MLDEVGKALGIELDDEDCDTFGGFVFGNYGSIPDDGTQFEIDAGDLHIRVLSIRDHKLEKALVCKASPHADNPET